MLVMVMLVMVVMVMVVMVIVMVIVVSVSCTSDLAAHNIIHVMVGVDDHITSCDVDEASYQY